MSIRSLSIFEIDLFNLCKIYAIVYSKFDFSANSFVPSAVFVITLARTMSSSFSVPSAVTASFAHKALDEVPTEISAIIQLMICYFHNTSKL